MSAKKKDPRPFHYTRCPKRADKTKRCRCDAIRSGVAREMFGVDLTKPVRTKGGKS